MNRTVRTSVVATAVLATALSGAAPAVAAPAVAGPVTVAPAVAGLAAFGPAVSPAFGAAVGDAAVGPAAASIAATKPLDVAKKAVTARIDLRLAALTTFSATLSQAQQVQSGHRSTLTALIKEQTTDLTTLRDKVGSETTRTAVKADATAMVDDFRVFILTGPKVRLTAAIDTELVVAGKLGPKADPVKASLDGKADTLLAIKPGPAGDAIRAQVKTIRDAAKSARTTLKSLRKK
jgi:hypothetical protein